MRTKTGSLGRISLNAATALAIAFGTGCAMPKPSGFLGNYSHLKRVNDSTWRYVDAARLATYNKYLISSVKVLVNSYDGTPLTSDQQEQAANRFREIIVKALTGECELVDKPSGRTAEVRAAITVAYPVGPSLTIGLEGEIIDAYSGQQLAAVMTYQSGPPQFEGGPPSLSEAALGWGWWNVHSAVWIMEDWADRLRKAIRESHGKSQARLDLWKKYYRKISKAVSPIRAAQFLQVENQMALFVDMSIASKMPTIGPVKAEGGTK
jgi:hypothetical protein